MFINAVKYEITMGVLEGYEFDDIADLDPLIWTALDKWKEIALEYYTITGVYISSVAIECDALYNEEWGCPRFGEPIVRFDCTMNPEFVKDEKVYEEGILYISKKLKEFFKQTTVNITKLPATVCYLKNEEN